MDLEDEGNVTTWAVASKVLNVINSREVIKDPADGWLKFETKNIIEHSNEVQINLIQKVNIYNATKSSFKRFTTNFWILVFI